MECFFAKVKAITGNEYELEDLLLCRYGSNIDYLLNKDLEAGFEMLKVAIEKTHEEKLWDIYVAKSIMAGENYPTFEQVLKDSKKIAKEKTTKNQYIKAEDTKKTIEKAVKIFKGKG